MNYAFILSLSKLIIMHRAAQRAIMLTALNTVFDALVASPLYMVIVGMGISPPYQPDFYDDSVITTNVT